MNIKKRLQILALVAGISLSCVTQVKAELTWKHYLGAAGAAGLALMLKKYFSEAATLRREQSALLQEANRLGIVNIGRRRGRMVITGYYAPVENPVTRVNPALERHRALKKEANHQAIDLDNSPTGQRLRAIDIRSREIDRRLQEIAAGR